MNLADFVQKFRPLSLGGSDPLITILTNVTRALFELTTYLFLISLLIAGMTYLFSLGNEDQIKRAHRTFYWSFVGFAVLVGVNAGINFYLSRIVLIEVNPVSAVAEIFTTAFLVAAITFLAVFLISGLRYFFAAGNEESEAVNRRAMTYAFIGLFVALAAFAMGRLIIDRVFVLD